MQERMQRAARLIDSTAGRIFRCTFEKKDGTLRTGTFRTHYAWERATDNPKLTRHYAREVHGLVKVVDMALARTVGKEKAIRSIPLDRVRVFSFAGQTVVL